MAPTQFEFVPPTTNTDGSVIPAGEIDKYILSVGIVAGGPYAITFNDTDVTANAAGHIVIPEDVLGVLVPGKYFAVVTAHTADGQVSDPSNEISFSVDPPAPKRPNPPTALTAV